jgi:uncharacterized repeat protein (TIGR04076 family)
MVGKAVNLKITVLRRFAPEEVFDKKPIGYEKLEACDVYTDGQEFIVGDDGLMPEGFCVWAWDDIYKDILTLRYNGDFEWFSEKGASVNCCTDGLRPVIFRIERLE